MKALVRAAIATSVLFFALAGYAQTWSKQQLQGAYIANLSQDGYRPEVTRSGNIRFKRQGWTYTLMIDEKDPLYFRLVTWFTVRDKSAAARHRRMESANVASRETKAVKVFVSARGNLGISAEFYQLTPGDGTSSLGRIFSSFDLAYKKYTKNF